MSAKPADEVDRIVDAWRRERPDLDVAPLQILSRVLRLARHLDLTRGSTFAEHGLEGWGFEVLSALRRAGAPYQLSPGQLVAQTLVTSGTMTNRVDRLAASGLVERGPDLRDRRGVTVTLTDAGRSVIDAAMATLLDRERIVLKELPSRGLARKLGSADNLGYREPFQLEGLAFVHDRAQGGVKRQHRRMVGCLGSHLDVNPVRLRCEPGQLAV